MLYRLCCYYSICASLALALETCPLTGSRSGSQVYAQVQLIEHFRSRPGYAMVGIMGQLPSTEHIPETMENVQGEIFRHARIITEIASLTYDDFQKCIRDLNVLSKQCTDPNGKLLVFAVKKGTDSTVLWKGTVRIACVKIDPVTKQIDTYRLLNLSEFLKVFNTLQCQFTAAQQSSTNERVLQESMSSSTLAGGYDAQNQMKQLTATMLLEEVDHVTSPPGERLNECCICLERKPDKNLSKLEPAQHTCHTPYRQRKDKEIIIILQSNGM
ncbi:Protein of unknown function [Gryllus bimaculatus]|nr:Protein of unknown function [Gryllus bimaculatus]